MLPAIPGHDRFIEAPADSLHHSDCPQHPWNDVFDEQEPCECPELLAADRAEAAEARGDR